MLVQCFIDEAEKRAMDMNEVIQLVVPATTAVISSLITKAVTVNSDRVNVISHLFVFSGTNNEIKILFKRCLNRDTGQLASIATI